MKIRVIKDIPGTPLKKGGVILNADRLSAMNLVRRGFVEVIEEELKSDEKELNSKKKVTEGGETGTEK